MEVVITGSAKEGPLGSLVFNPPDMEILGTTDSWTLDSKGFGTKGNIFTAARTDIRGPITLDARHKHLKTAFVDFGMVA